MDSTRSMLLALAGLATQARLRWEADRAAVRARGETPGRTETFAHHVMARQCLLAAIRAADLPAGFTLYDATLSRDPAVAATQLQEIAYGRDPSGPIEAEHEPTRLAYQAAAAQPITEQEQRYIDILAGLPATRRDKIVDLAEQHARWQQRAGH